MERLYGETISKDVVNQLDLRADVLGRSGIRSSNDLRYLNEKTAWIRMISSVNRYNPEQGSFFNRDAKNFILSGGELSWNGTKFVPRSGFNTNLQQGRGRYSYNENLGIRPESGITSFSISHKNTFGTIREANISFNVWTREDLNLVQDLYLRPGISVIVEWGNSIYLDDDGNVKDTISIPSYEEYFKKQSREKIAKILVENKKNNFYNYDAFIGLVSNFSWNFRPDGGYDCTLKAVTTGAILENLTVIKPKSAVELELRERAQIDYFLGKNGNYYDISAKDRVDPNTSSKENEKYSNRTFLHFFAKDIEKYLDGNDDNQDPLSYDSFVKRVYLGQPGEYPKDYKKERPAPYINALKEQLGTEDTGRSYDRNFIVTGFTTKVNKEVTAIQYISLRTLLALLNISFSFKNPDGDSIVSFYTGEEISTDEGIVDSISTDPKFKTFQNHFSLNPLYCLIPNLPTDKAYLDKDGNPITAIKKGNVSNHLQLTKEPFDSIFNIFVNIHAVLEDLDSIYEGVKEPKKANVFDFIKKVLTNINSYLGGINELDLHFDEDKQKWIVVDRQLIVEELKKNGTKIEIVNITGLKTTASSVSLQTKITSELTSQIAISAQGTKAYDPNTSLPLFEWNSNIQDRFFQPKTTPEPPLLRTPFTEGEEEGKQKEEEKKAREEFINNIKSAFYELNDSGTKSIGILNLYEKNFRSEVFEKIKGDGIIRFKNAVYGKTYGNTKQPIDGLIPIDLEITLDGISGLKIGQVFRIGSLEEPSNILPDIYNKYGFIITGLDNKIENGKWLTTIRGITFQFEVDATDPTDTKQADVTLYEDVFISDTVNTLNNSGNINFSSYQKGKV